MGNGSVAQLLLVLLVKIWKVYGINNYNVAQVADGSPKVDCMVDRIKMTVDMLKGTPSEIFVKGRHHTGGSCVAKNTFMFTIKHDECGLRPERSLNPAGLHFRTCLVVKLHPFFVTMVDKTYCVSCFYMEAVKNIQPIDIGVSMLPQTEVGVSFPMPVCSHSIRRGSPTGPIIRYATVGEPIFHVWSCPSEQYGMLVQNCYVSDDQGKRIQIINGDGCGIDKYIIETPLYNQDLTMAYRESCVFKFADKPVTRFNCQIKVCIKPGGGCEGVTPPSNCPDLTGSRPFPSPGSRPFPFSTDLAVEQAPTMVEPEYRLQHHSRDRRPLPRTLLLNRFSREIHSKSVNVTNHSKNVSETIANDGDQPKKNGPVHSKNLSDSASLSADQSVDDYDKKKSDQVGTMDDGFDYMDVQSEIFVLEAPDNEDSLLDQLMNDIGSSSVQRSRVDKTAVCVPRHIFTSVLILAPLLFGMHATFTVSLILRIRNLKGNGSN